MDAGLNAPNGGNHRALIDNRRHLLICIEPATEGAIEILNRPLADSGDIRPGLSEDTGEVSLIGGELWSYEDDVHGNLMVRRRRLSRFPG